MKRKLEQIIESENAANKSPRPDQINPPQHPKTHPIAEENPSARARHEKMNSKIWKPTNENHKGPKI